MEIAYEFAWNILAIMMNSQRLEWELSVSNVVLAASVERLEKASSEITVLSGLLPICASCRKIRDDAGYWQQLGSHIQKHSEARFSHGICPDCLRRFYPEFADELLDGKPEDEVR